MTEEGRQQARAAGELLRSRRLTRFAQVLTSSLGRASETCRLAGFQGKDEPDLLEWDYGAYEGLTTAEIRKTRPGWSLWEDGVPEGETASEVGRRADRVVARVLRRDDGDTLCVAHGHILRVLAARWLGLPPVAGRFLLFESGAIGVLSWEHEWAALEVWNLTPD